jgi:serine protease Do
MAPGTEIWEYYFPGLFPRREFRQDVQGFGSGFLISPEGYIVTNDHVIERADEVIVTLSDGRQFPAQHLDSAKDYDLALLKIEGKDLPFAPLAADHELYIGEWVIAIGSPFGYLLADTQPTVTVGVISALNRDIKNQTGQSNERIYLGMIQTDAAINPGNSGGPLVDANGAVIGINTFIITGSGGSIGLGFAVPAERAKWLIRDVKEFGRFRQAYLGVYFVRLSANLMRALDVSDPVGFVVRDVEQGSPAYKAGLRTYDIVREINGVALKDVDTLWRLVYEARVGDRLTFTTEREGRRSEAQITLEERPRTARQGR